METGRWNGSRDRRRGSSRVVVAACVSLAVCVAAGLVWFCTANRAGEQPENRVEESPYAAERGESRVPRVARPGSDVPMASVRVPPVEVDAPRSATDGRTSEPSFAEAAPEAPSQIAYEPPSAADYSLMTKAIEDVSWIAKDRDWNPEGKLLDARAETELRALIESYRADFTTARKEFMPRSSAVLAQLGDEELERRSRIPVPKGSIRKSAHTIGGKTIEVPLTPLHVPEITGEIVALESIPKRLGEEVRQFFRYRVR